jgi:hypothetical protein
MALANRVELAPKLSTAVQRYSAGGLSSARRAYVRLEVTAIGATPSMTYTIQGSNDDGATWADLEYVTPDSAVAVSKAAVVVTTVSVAQYFIDGLDKRFFDKYAINVSANLNVTFKADIYFVSGEGF